MKKNELVREELRRLARANRKKQLLPSAVVEAARDPNNPLHDKFNWDDSAAAHQWRLFQARQLIANVELAADNRFESAPEYVSLRMDRKSGGYRRMSDVLSSKALRQEMLATAVTELKAMQFRFDRLRELAGVFREAKKVERRVTSNGPKKGLAHAAGRSL